MLIVDDKFSAKSASENAEKIVSTKKDHKKKHKGLKKQNKLLREQNELLRGQNEILREQNECLKKNEEHQQREAEETTKSKREIGFLSKVGDAFCKALPGILSTIATAAIGYFFNTKGRRAKAAA